MHLPKASLEIPKGTSYRNAASAATKALSQESKEASGQLSTPCPSCWGGAATQAKDRTVLTIVLDPPDYLGPQAPGLQERLLWALPSQKALV